MSCVYGLAPLSDPTNIRYVGRTRNNTPELRLLAHKKAAKTNYSTHIYNWLRSVAASGDDIVAVIIENDLTVEESCAREIYWIKFYKDSGHKLTNMTDGGEGMLNPTEDTRRRLSAAVRGAMTEEIRKKISDSSKNRKHSQETKNKIGKAHRNKVVTKQARKNISAALTLPDIRNKLIANGKSSKGRAISTAGKANMSAAQQLRRDAHVEIAKKVNSMSVSCADCGITSTPGPLSIHLKATGHKKK